MPVLRTHKFTDINEMEFFFQGGLLGSRTIVPIAGSGATRSPGGGIAGLVGQTLTIQAPVASVTFVAATVPPGVSRDPTMLMFSDIKAQIEAAAATIKVVQINGRIGIIEATPTNGITLNAVNETARALLGLPNNQAARTYKYSPLGIAVPALVQFNCLENTHIAITWE